MSWQEGGPGPPEALYRAAVLGSVLLLRHCSHCVQNLLCACTE